MKKTVLNLALSAVFMVTVAASISACSSETEHTGEESGEILAVDRVDDAAELARKNGPEAEDMEFPEMAPMPAADTEAQGTMAAEDGMASTDNMSEAMPATEAMPANSTDAAMTTGDNADMPATEPATN